MNLLEKTISAPRQAARAFTLLEMMFSMTIFSMVTLALISAQMMGLRENQLIESKCGASDSSRRVLSKLPEDIRSAKMWQIGSLSGQTFAGITNNSAQNGGALQLFQTTNNSAYIMYYFDTTDVANNNAKLMRYTSANTNPVCLTSNLVNWLTDGFSFVAEDFTGAVTTNQGTSKAYKNVIHVKLQFAQFLYPLTPVGTNGLYDYYKMEFRATPHLPE
jgi:prepilin-type N-terminal cleavage/methylation domain-containing protein